MTWTAKRPELRPALEGRPAVRRRAVRNALFDSDFKFTCIDLPES